MTNDPKHRRRERISPGGSGSDELMAALGELSVPSAFRQAVDPSLALADIAKAVKRVREAFGAILASDLSRAGSGINQTAMIESLARYHTGLLAELSVEMSSAGIENPDVIAVPEASGIKLDPPGSSKAKFLVQLYLQDSNHQYYGVSIGPRGRPVFERSQYPISNYLLGSRDEDGVRDFPYPIFSHPAFAAQVNKNPLGSVLQTALSEEVTKFLSQARRDALITEAEWGQLDASELVKAARRERSGQFLVRIRKHEFRFQLSLNEDLIPCAKFVDQVEQRS